MESTGDNPTQVTLEEFPSPSRGLSASDLFYVFQRQSGEVALPASFLLAFVQKYMGAGVFVTTGIPDNSEGTDGSYSVDLANGNWYGPRVNGVWPTTPNGLVAGGLTAAFQEELNNDILDIVQANAAGVILVTSAPDSGTGTNGQVAFDLTNGLVYGPKENNSWGSAVSITASNVTASLRTSLTNSAVAAIEGILAQQTGATLIGYGQTTVASELDALGQAVQELQGTSTGGTVTYTQTSMSITASNVGQTVAFYGTQETNPIFTVANGASFSANTVLYVDNKATNPNAVLTLSLSGSGNYFSTAAYSNTNTNITSIQLRQGDTVKIGLTGGNNFVLLDGTALLQFSQTTVFQPDLGDVSAKPSTTLFSKTLRHGLTSIAITNQTSITITDQQAANAVIEFTGTLTANLPVTMPDRNGTYKIRNATTNSGQFQLVVGLDESSTDVVQIGSGILADMIVRQDQGVYLTSSSQSTSNSALTIYSTTIGNVNAGDTVIPTNGFTAPLLNFFANGAYQTRGLDYTLNGNNIQLTNPVQAGVNYVVTTNSLINNNSYFSATVIPLTLPANETTITYPYSPGFLDVYVGGVYITDYVAVDGQTIVFPADFVSNEDREVALKLQIPITLTGMLTYQDLVQAKAFSQNYTSSVSRTFLDKMRDTVSVKDFGAKGNGTTDDTLAIQTAVNVAIANGISYLYFPFGTYLISQAISISQPLFLIGDGAFKTVIRQSSATADGLDFNFAAYYQGGGVMDLSVESGAGWLTAGFQGDGSSGIGISVQNSNGKFYASRYGVHNFATAVQVEGSYYTCWSHFEHMYCATAAFVVDKSTLGGLGAGTWVHHGKQSNFGYTGSSTTSKGIALYNSSGDFFDNIDSTSFGNGVVIQPKPGGTVTYAFFNRVLGDTSINDNWLVDSTNGTITSIGCVDCWAGYSTNGAGLHTKGSSTDSFRWLGGRLRENGKQGWWHEGGINVELSAVEIASNSKLTNNTYDGVLIAPNVSFWSIQNSRIGNFGSSLTGQANGITISAGTSQNFRITGNNLMNPGTGKVPIAIGTSALNWIIGDNLPLLSVGVNPSRTTAYSGSSIGQIAASTTTYLGSNAQQANAPDTVIVFDQQRLLVQIIIQLETAPGAGTVTATFWKNGAATSMTGSLTGSGAFQLVITANPVQINPGDYGCIQITTSSNAAATRIRWVMSLSQ